MADRDSAAHLFGLLFAFNQRLAAVADTHLEAYGITSRQWLLLAVVSQHRTTGLTLTEAAQLHGSSRQNVSTLARQLERKGFLTLTPDATDKRATRLRLGARAAEFDTPTAMRDQQAVIDRVFRTLAPTEVDTLNTLITRLMEDHREH